MAYRPGCPSCSPSYQQASSSQPGRPRQVGHLLEHRLEPRSTPSAASRDPAPGPGASTATSAAQQPSSVGQHVDRVGGGAQVGDPLAPPRPCRPRPAPPRAGPRARGPRGPGRHRPATPRRRRWAEAREQPSDVRGVDGRVRHVFCGERSRDVRTWSRGRATASLAAAAAARRSGTPAAPRVDGTAGEPDATRSGCDSRHSRLGAGRRAVRVSRAVTRRAASHVVTAARRARLPLAGPRRLRPRRQLAQR